MFPGEYHFLLSLTHSRFEALTEFPHPDVFYLLNDTIIDTVVTFPSRVITNAIDDMSGRSNLSVCSRSVPTRGYFELTTSPPSSQEYIWKPLSCYMPSSVFTRDRNNSFINTTTSGPYNVLIMGDSHTRLTHTYLLALLRGDPRNLTDWRKYNESLESFGPRPFTVQYQHDPYLQTTWQKSEREKLFNEKHFVLFQIGQWPVCTI